MNNKNRQAAAKIASKGAPRTQQAREADQELKEQPKVRVTVDLPADVHAEFTAVAARERTHMGYLMAAFAKTIVEDPEMVDVVRHNLELRKRRGGS